MEREFAVGCDVRACETGAAMWAPDGGIGTLDGDETCERVSDGVDDRSFDLAVGSRESVDAAGVASADRDGEPARGRESRRQLKFD